MMCERRQEDERVEGELCFHVLREGKEVDKVFSLPGVLCAPVTQSSTDQHDCKAFG